MSESDEDFVEYGTPLEPLDKDAVPIKKPLTLQEQVVRDNEGRRRFHGAFTGGFSAGFFNTVGSQEGWQPSEFKSSRADKGKHKQQKPEDFMDDEDMGEYGIAPKVLRGSSDYGDIKTLKRLRPQFSDGPIPGEPVLGQLLQPIRETVGVKLLKKMGWKPGQGIGPRMSKQQKEKQKSEIESGQKMYGCALPPQRDNRLAEDDESSESDIELNLERLSFAPDDYKPYICRPKDNVFGLGYVGLDKTPILGAHINLFGTSQLKMQEKNRKVNIKGQAFGVGAFEDEDEDIYTTEDMSQYDFTMGSSSKADKQRTRDTRWSDCNIEGFIRAKMKCEKKYFAPPSLPKNYVPEHVVKVSRFEPAVERSSVKNNYTVTERGVLLSEESASSSKKDTDACQVSSVIEEARKLTKDLISSVTISSTFKPFAAFPDKQKRYEEYLKLVELEHEEKLVHLQPITMTEWDKERERLEFAQAAKLYRPMSGAMGDRFVSALQPDDLNNPLAAVEKFKHGNDDEINASKLKMFGKLTRKTVEWTPCSLLCKRFNVPEPRQSSSNQNQTSRKKDLCSLFDCLDQSNKNEKFEERVERVEIQQVTETVVSETVEAESVAEEENLPTEKIDLFKSIFLDSDEEEETVTAESQGKITDNETFEQNLFNIIPSEINNEKPSGLFEGVDFDILNKKPEKVRDVVLPVPEPEPETYGPSLPTVIQKSVNNANVDNINVVISEEWIEKGVEKHKKKDKKQKKSKHKHKHKKKR